MRFKGFRVNPHSSVVPGPGRVSASSGKAAAEFGLGFVSKVSESEESQNASKSYLLQARYKGTSFTAAGKAHRLKHMSSEPLLQHEAHLVCR